jgi:hypothetical protein
MSEHLLHGGWYKQRVAREWPDAETHNERVIASIQSWREAASPDDALIRIPVVKIVKTVCDVYKVGYGELVGPRRHKYLIYPRYHAMALTVSLRPDLSLTTIGQQFNRDHSTIIHGRNAWYSTWFEGKGEAIAAVNAILFPDAEPMVG